MLFRKVLVDSGSVLNILFAKALKELGLSLSDLTPFDSTFWGVVPGRASKLLGEITLPVQFGMQATTASNISTFTSPTSTPPTTPYLVGQL